MHVGALGRRHARPRAVVERLARRGDGAVDVGRRSPRGPAMTSSVERRDDLELVGAGGVDPVAADEELVSVHRCLLLRVDVGAHGSPSAGGIPECRRWSRCRPDRPVPALTSGRRACRARGRPRPRTVRRGHPSRSPRPVRRRPSRSNITVHVRTVPGPGVVLHHRHRSLDRGRRGTDAVDRSRIARVGTRVVAPTPGRGASC